MIVYPEDDEPRFETVAIADKDGYNSTKITMNYHLGTQMCIRDRLWRHLSLKLAMKWLLLR